MRRLPKLTEVPHYPVVAGTALLAIGVSIARWRAVDVSLLSESAMIRRGELWRLVTSILPHGGVLHLLFNVYWLWIFGSLVEETYGHVKTLALILLLAIGSNSLEYALLVGGIGLSGVVYGLFGLLWVLSRHDGRFRDAIDRSTVEIFVGWFFLCILTTVTHLMTIANIAHGAGAVLGIFTGFAITRPNLRTSIITGIGAILLIALWAATLGRPEVNLSGKGGYEEGEWGYQALRAHKNRDAVRWFRDAIAYQPKRSEYWYNLGIAYQNLDDKSAAIDAYRRAADQGAAKAQYYLGTLYESGDQGLSKDTTQALHWYRRAAAQNDTDALNGVAWTYATSPDPAIRNPIAALDYARKAITLESDHPDPNHIDTLAEAYYANGRYEDAVKMEQHAIAAASPQNRSDFQKRLERFERASKESRKTGKHEVNPLPLNR
jgi:membrane associated rhomboid family serine protease